MQGLRNGGTAVGGFLLLYHIPLYLKAEQYMTGQKIQIGKTKVKKRNCNSNLH